MEYYYQSEIIKYALINNTIYNTNNSIRNEIESEDEQKIALEEFKKLLNKIDEKLDIPIKKKY